MIEHCIVAGLAIALATLLNSRVHWHFHYRVRTVTVRRKEGAEDNRIPEQRAVLSRPYKSTQERIEEQKAELEILLNLHPIYTEAVGIAFEERISLSEALESLKTDYFARP